MSNIIYKPIGVMHSSFENPKGMPIQPSGAEGQKGIIEVYKEYEEGLKDIEGFSHIYVIYHLHKITKSKLSVIPFMDVIPHGIFATRAPARPNAIGLSVLRLMQRENNLLIVDGIDILDATPILDLKPFFEKYDNRFNTKRGWLNNNNRAEQIKADNRFV
jgi:tRNA (adenine37-N6)-methyltransferase